MRKEFELTLSFGPRLAWWVAAFWFLFVPRPAATGDSIDARNQLTAPQGVFETLVTTGPTDLLYEDPATDDDGLIPIQTPNPASGQSWGKVLVGVTAANAVYGGAAAATNAEWPTNNEAGTGVGASAMVINGHLHVTGCIYLNGNPKCNWCRVGQTCNPAPTD